MKYQNFFTKDGDDDHAALIKQAKEPEVVKAILKEIKGFGDGFTAMKTNHDELQTSLEALKKLVEETDEKLAEKVDPLIATQITKLSEDVSTRQGELDKQNADMAEFQKKLETEVNHRMDLLEVALKRPQGDTAGGKESQEAKDAMEFLVTSVAVRGAGAGVKYNQRKQLEADVEGFKAYKRIFEDFLRNSGGERGLSAEDLKALSVGIDPDGGYTVTPAMSNRVINRIYESDPIRQLCSVESITTGAIEWMVDWGQAGFGWEGEIETGAATTEPDFKKKRIPVHVMYAKPKATQTLIEDSGINIENWIADHVARRFARAEGAAFVEGDGVGKPMGFLSYGNVTTAGTPEWGKVEQVNMGLASALTADGIIDVKFSLVEDYLTRGTWLANRLTVADIMQLKDGNGQYIWRAGLEPTQPSLLLGLPIRMSTSVPVVATNSLSLALADWREAYMIVDRLGITLQRDPYTAKPLVEFYTRKRVGGDVINFEAIVIGKVAA